MQNPHQTTEAESRSTLPRLRMLALACAALASTALARAIETTDAATGDMVDETVNLEKIAVTGERIESKNYKVQESLTATKTNTPLLDVPQSITIVTEQQ